MSADGYQSPPDFDFEISPEVKSDIQAMHARALRNPDDRHLANLVQVSLNALGELKTGHPGTKALEPMASYPDLSDCRTLYVGADMNHKPSHRIVFRDVQPAHPGARVRREVLALGGREAGRVYQSAGLRLGRPIGLSLNQLQNLPEPTADRSPATDAHRVVPVPKPDSPAPESYDGLSL